MPPTYVYTGTEERTYPAYLQVADDGTFQTLQGRPGSGPVCIRRAAGNEELPEIPADGQWLAVTEKKNQTPAKDTDPAGNQSNGSTDQAAARASKTRKAAS
ncbi:hypothetical protein GCM10023196_036920 [Actinoallomurus vinaceus]|uniref:DUF397 domain-containing protein n=1 Tax=Actinoallomurus vinaceus TaxID=1080074 RepID=A0ABP8UCX5_9ACTN